MLNITLNTLKNGGAVMLSACWSGLSASGVSRQGASLDAIGVPVCVDQEAKTVLVRPAGEIPSGLGVIPIVPGAPEGFLTFKPSAFPVLLKTRTPRLFASGRWDKVNFWDAAPAELYVHADDVVPVEEGQWMVEAANWDGACELEAAGRVRIVGTRNGGSREFSRAAHRLALRFCSPALSRAEWHLLGMICLWHEAAAGDAARPLLPEYGGGRDMLGRSFLVPADAAQLEQLGVWPTTAVYADDSLDSLLCLGLTLRDPARAAASLGRPVLANLPKGATLLTRPEDSTRRHFEFTPDGFAALKFASSPELASRSRVVLKWAEGEGRAVLDLTRRAKATDADRYMVCAEHPNISALLGDGLIRCEQFSYGNKEAVVLGLPEVLERDFIRVPEFSQTHVPPEGVKVAKCFLFCRGSVSSSFQAYERAQVANAETVKEYRAKSRRRKSDFKGRVLAELGYVPDSFKRLRNPSEKDLLAYIELYQRVKAGELIERDMFVAELDEKTGISDKDYAVQLWRSVCNNGAKEDRKFIHFEPARCEFESAKVASVESLTSERIGWLFNYAIGHSIRPFVRRLLRDGELRDRLELAILTGEFK